METMTVEMSTDGEITGLVFDKTSLTTDTSFDDADAEGVREQPPQDASAQSELEGLIYESGVTSNETRAITADGDGWDLSAKAGGVGAGIGTSESSSSERLMDARYLQPPESPGESRTMADAPC